MRLWKSLTVRLIGGVALAWVGGIAALTWYASATLREDLESEISRRQYDALGILAQAVQSAFDERLQPLQLIAQAQYDRKPLHAIDLTTLPQQRPLLFQLFKGGVVLTDANAKVLTASPGAWFAPGNALLHDTAVQAVLETGRPRIALPTEIHGPSGARITFAVPVWDPDQRVAGVFAGFVSLPDSHFLERFTNERIGLNSTFVLVDPARRIIVTATDPQRNLQSLPPPGAIAAVDRFAAGLQGSSVYLSPSGREVLSSSKRLVQPEWDLGVLQPTAEAFAPVRRQQQRLYLASALVGFLGLIIGLPLLWRELRPMRDAASTLRAMHEGSGSLQALPEPEQTELAELIAGFNRLLQSLGEREGELSDLFDTSSVGILLVDTTSRIVRANPHMGQLFRCDASALLGCRYAELVDPSQRELADSRTQALISARMDTVDVDRLFLRSDGSTFWGRLTGRRMYDHHGQLRGLVGTITDITAHKQLQQFDQSRSAILEMLANDQALDAILLASVRGVEEIMPGAICSCMLLSEDGTCLGTSIGPSLPDFYIEAIANLRIGPTVGSCGAAAALGQRVVAENLQTHPNWTAFAELTTRAGLGSCWSQPIFSGSGKVLGTFAIYHAQPNVPTDTDILIIEQSARLVSIAIERSRVAAQLRDREAHYRLLTEGVSDVVWRMDRHQVFTYISPADERMRGFGAHEVIGRPAIELMTPASAEVLKARTASRPTVDTPDVHRDTLTLVLEQRRKDGGSVWTEIRSTAERDADGVITGYHGVTRDISERRSAEDRLRLAASVLSHAREGIMITSGPGLILEVNAAFTTITGFSREEALGQTPRMLRSGRHDEAFLQTLFAQLHRDGVWQGEVWNRRKDGTLYVQHETISAVRDEAGDLLHYVSLFSDITAEKQRQQQLEHHAHYDQLTGLPNRSLLMDRLLHAMAQSQRRDSPIAVVFIDLDGFKDVNDQHGHAVGDLVLQALAHRMRAALRDGDTLARLGGDEFVAVLIDLPNPHASEPLLQRLLAAAAQPVTVGALELQVSASLGVSFFPQSAEVAADQLLRQADQAMYQAKLAGKNRCHRHHSA